MKNGKETNFIFVPSLKAKRPTSSRKIRQNDGEKIDKSPIIHEKLKIDTGKISNKTLSKHQKKKIINVATLSPLPISPKNSFIEANVAKDVLKKELGIDESNDDFVINVIVNDNVCDIENETNDAKVVVFDEKMKKSKKEKKKNSIFNGFVSAFEERENDMICNIERMHLDLISRFQAIEKTLDNICIKYSSEKGN